MTFLFAFLSFFLADIEPSISNLINDHIGEWEFSVVTPDYTYKGVMELSKEGDAYSGLIISEGVETELKDVFKCVVCGLIINERLDDRKEDGEI